MKINLLALSISFIYVGVGTLTLFKPYLNISIILDHFFCSYVDILAPSRFVGGILFFITNKILKGYLFGIIGQIVTFHLLSSISSLKN